MVAGINIYVIQIEHTIKWSATIIFWFDPFSVQYLLYKLWVFLGHPKNTYCMKIKQISEEETTEVYAIYSFNLCL